MAGINVDVPLRKGDLNADFVEAMINFQPKLTGDRERPVYVRKEIAQTDEQAAIPKLVKRHRRLRVRQHQQLAPVVIANGGCPHLYPGYRSRDIANRHSIAQSNRLFKQDYQAADKIGDHLLQAKSDTQTQCGDSPLQRRPTDTWRALNISNRVTGSEISRPSTMIVWCQKLNESRSTVRPIGSQTL
jgi:hypothetical protein